MRQLMNLIHNVPILKQPRIIGLTGILLLDSTPAAVLENLVQLENVFRATIATVNTNAEFDNVLIYSTKPKEQVVIHENLMSSTTAMEAVRKLVTQFLVDIEHVKVEDTNKMIKENCVSPIKQAKKLFNDFIYQMDDSGKIFRFSNKICS